MQAQRLKELLLELCWMGGLLLCAGAIVLKGAADQVRPEWFRNAGESDSIPLQQAVNACKGRCTVMLTQRRLPIRVRHPCCLACLVAACSLASWPCFFAGWLVVNLFSPSSSAGAPVRGKGRGWWGGILKILAWLQQQYVFNACAS